MFYVTIRIDEQAVVVVYSVVVLFSTLLPQPKKFR